MEKTIEERTAEVLLEKPEKVTVAGQTYIVPPPTLATLIRVSEVISHMPRRQLDTERIAEESLAVARECWPIGMVAAILILGAREADVKPVTRRRRLWGLLPDRESVSRRTRAQMLAREIEREFTPGAVKDLVARLMGHLQLADFFALTTFLTEINLTRPTKVEKS